MKFVKKEVLRKKNKPENNRLKYLLHKSIAKFQPQRSIDVLHASDTTKKDFCPARIALMRLHKVKPKDEFIPTALRVTFDYGRFLEDSVIGYLGGLVVGNWVCKECDHYQLMQKQPKICKKLEKSGCEGTDFIFTEPRWYDEETALSCGTDFFVDLGEDKPILVELKSLKVADFKTISRPRKEHLLRTKLYLHILKRNGITEVNVDEALVLYTCKGYGFADDFIRSSDLPDAPFSPFREFTVRREDDEEVDRIFADALAIKKATPKVLPRKMCPNKHCTQAKNCEVREVCFG